ATIPQVALKPPAFHRVHQGARAQGESNIAKVRCVILLLPRRAGQSPQQESSAPVARRPFPNLPPGETRCLRDYFILKPAAQGVQAPPVERALTVCSRCANRDVPRFS